MSVQPYAVIMAGGSGTRFWPVSRRQHPKQLVRIVGQDTMIQATVARLQPTFAAERILIVTTAALADETRRQLPMLKPEHVIAEPVGRDTAACVCLAAMIVERMEPGATMALLPADAVISPADSFQRALLAGAEEAQSGNLVTFGIAPRCASTGYGYVQLGAERPAIDGIPVNEVQRFVEKPDQQTAEGYLASGAYRWNSGIFIWRSDVVLRELAQHSGWLVDALRPVEAAWGSPVFDERLRDAYEPLRKISIDYALLEKAAHISVLTPDFAWDDVGSWDALYDHLPLGEAGVIQRGNTLAIECHDSMLLAESGQLIAAVGLEGVSVIATDDAILVCAKGRSQGVKQIVERLKESGRDDLT